MVMKYRREKATIFVILVTEVLGFSLILPFLPYLAESFGATPFQIGLISTVFSLFQFFSAPIMGAISDVVGRKPMLVLSQTSTLISFIILGFANSLPLIFLSRIVDGVLGSNFTIAQAYLSDLTSKKNRSKSFALSGIAFAIGFLVGPALGGFLSTRTSYLVPSLLAAGISLITVLITIFFLPETVTKSDETIEVSIFNTDRFKKYLTNPNINRQFGQFFLYILAHTTWISSFALYTKEKFGISPQQIGLFYAYIGLVNIIFRGLVLNELINKYNELRLQIISIISIIVGLIGASLAPNPILMTLIMTFFAFGGGMFRPLIIGNISKSTPEKEQGAVLGTTNSLGSIAQIFGPLIGGFSLQNFSPVVLGLTAASFLVLSLIIRLPDYLKIR